MQLAGRATRGSLDLLCLKEGHGGLGGSRAIPFVFREMRVANREGRTYPFLRVTYYASPLIRTTYYCIPYVIRLPYIV